MAKRKEKPPEEGSPAWMATFSDLMNLLLCFFVLLFASSSVDEGKIQRIAASFNDISFSILESGSISLEEGPVVSGGVTQLPGIESFLEYIGVCKKYGKTSVLELKNRIEKSEIERITEIIKGEGYIDDVIFISFDWQNMIDVRSIYPKSRVQFLCCKCDDELIERLTQHKIDLDIDKKSVTPELIQKLHERGLEINCWTVDDKEEAERLVSWGIDYITSNILE